jgi:hypothetical protein
LEILLQVLPGIQLEKLLALSQRKTVLMMHQTNEEEFIRFVSDTLFDWPKEP